MYDSIKGVKPPFTLTCKDAKDIQHKATIQTGVTFKNALAASLPRIAQLVEKSKQSESIQGDLKLVVTTLQKPERFYQDADRRKKKQLLSSIYPEKLTFDE